MTMSGKTAIATARTMRGMLMMKSAIDTFGTVGNGFLLLACHPEGWSDGGSENSVSAS
jgi:hypothetical protein